MEGWNVILNLAIAPFSNNMLSEVDKLNPTSFETIESFLKAFPTLP